jgi:hypothetical protein
MGVALLADQARRGPCCISFDCYGPMLDELGLGDPLRIFDDPRIQVWRKLEDRENASLDATLADGRAVRFHIKRYPPLAGWRRRGTPAQAEARGVELLRRAGIGTIPLAAVGVLPDGRSFTISEHLEGYGQADKLIESGRVSCDTLLEPTAALAARLHEAQLHHRDLYLCHFFVRLDSDRAVTDMRLIDVARVSGLGVLLARRWIVKDLAQFIYSTRALPVSDQQRAAWLDRYCAIRGLSAVQSLGAAVARKANWIARHDARLRNSQPGRNISIPRA